MDEFAHSQNVERFEYQLRTETDPQRRAMLERLLAEERQHLERLRPAREAQQ